MKGHAYLLLASADGQRCPEIRRRPPELTRPGSVALPCAGELPDNMITSSTVQILAILRSVFTRPVTERLPRPPGPARAARFPGSVQLRHVDAASCNGCELEIASAFGPVYDAERFGARLTASPRHADGVLVTGVVTHNMAVPLKKTFEAVPKPRVVIACGDCALGGGPFAGGYGVAGDGGAIAEPDIAIPGCPPDPIAITQALRALTGR